MHSTNRSRAAIYFSPIWNGCLQVFNTGPPPFFRVEKAGKIAVFHTVFSRPNPLSRLRRQLSRRGSLFAVNRQMLKSSPFGGAGCDHREQTERVRALPGRPGCCRFRQRLSLWESWTRSGLRGLGCYRADREQTPPVSLRSTAPSGMGPLAVRKSFRLKCKACGTPEAPSQRELAKPIGFD